MTVQHKVDDNLKLITTTVTGEATDGKLIDALSNYQQTIRIQSDHNSYNEIVDMSNVSKFKLSTEGIKELVQIGTQTDAAGIKTRLAIIVTKPVAYGLARMYEIYRSLQPHVVKELRIFMKYEDALEWVKRKTDE